MEPAVCFKREWELIRRRKEEGFQAEETVCQVWSHEGSCLVRELWVATCGVRLFVTPWTAAYQGPPSMGFARQEYEWGAIAFSSFED